MLSDTNAARKHHLRLHLRCECAFRSPSTYSLRSRGVSV